MLKAVTTEAAVKAHFADFDVASARLVQAESARLVHVSYRIGDRIYWTKQKVEVAQGEQLLTDGTHLMRARCGNRIAEEPQSPVLDHEPAPEVLDALFVPSGGPTEPAAPTDSTDSTEPTEPTEPAAVQPGTAKPTSILAGVTDAIAGTATDTAEPVKNNTRPAPRTPAVLQPVVTTKAPPPTPVPEPGALWLFGLALCALGSARRAGMRS